MFQVEFECIINFNQNITSLILLSACQYYIGHQRAVWHFLHQSVCVCVRARAQKCIMTWVLLKRRKRMALKTF